MKTFLFTDLEFSGLDMEKNRPLEIAIIATDANLCVIDTYHQTFFWDSIVFNEWSEASHLASGLLAEIENGADASQIDLDLCSFVKKLKGDLILAGQSVHIDKAWISKYLPKFNSKLNHRLLDLTSVDMILEDIGSAVKPRPRSHRAEDDAKSSLDRARHYRNSIKYESLL